MDKPVIIPEPVLRHLLAIAKSYMSMCSEEGEWVTASEWLQMRETERIIAEYSGTQPVPFGPVTPIQPVPVDESQLREASPRLWQYRVG